MGQVCSFVLSDPATRQILKEDNEKTKSDEITRTKAEIKQGRSTRRRGQLHFYIICNATHTYT